MPAVSSKSAVRLQKRYTHGINVTVFDRILYHIRIYTRVEILLEEYLKPIQVTKAPNSGESLEMSRIKLDISYRV